MEFHFLQTDDGSPSLRLDVAGEAMHSSKGAFSETVYIYGHAIETTLGHNFPPSFLSLGLGLGYNELLATSLLLRNHADLLSLHGESFELIPELNENFKAWLRDDEIDSEFQKTYDQICNLCAKHTQQEQIHIKTTLAKFIENGQWRIHGPLTPQTKVGRKISCFFFDAFSSKTSPELWSEDFISEFLSSCADEKAVLATYACTGTLKRALQRNAFTVDVRPGFAGKRESTFAIRGV